MHNGECQQAPLQWNETFPVQPKPANSVESLLNRTHNSFTFGCLF